MQRCCQSIAARRARTRERMRQRRGQEEVVRERCGYRERARRATSPAFDNPRSVLPGGGCPELERTPGGAARRSMARGRDGRPKAGVVTWRRREQRVVTRRVDVDHPGKAEIALRVRYTRHASERRRLARARRRQMRTPLMAACAGKVPVLIFAVRGTITRQPPSLPLSFRLHHANNDGVRHAYHCLHSRRHR